MMNDTLEVHASSRRRKKKIACCRVSNLSDHLYISLYDRNLAGVLTVAPCLYHLLELCPRNVFLLRWFCSSWCSLAILLLLSATGEKDVAYILIFILLKGMTLAYTLFIYYPTQTVCHETNSTEKLYYIE